MNAKVSQQLSVVVEGGQLKISIGIALLAFAVQSQDNWPEEFAVVDLREFAKSMARQLQREEEDGTTPVHRMLDTAAEAVLEQGDDGVDEGDVEDGIALAKFALDAEAKALKAKVASNAEPPKPDAWLVKIFGNDGSLLDTRLDFVRPLIGSTAKTEFVPLYAAANEPSGGDHA